jgi:hypothetical protein
LTEARAAFRCLRADGVESSWRVEFHDEWEGGEK